MAEKIDLFEKNKLSQRNISNIFLDVQHVVWIFNSVKICKTYL